MGRSSADGNAVGFQYTACLVCFHRTKAELCTLLDIREQAATNAQN